MARATKTIAALLTAPFLAVAVLIGLGSAGDASAQEITVAYLPEPGRGMEPVAIGRPELLSKWRPLAGVVAAAASPVESLPTRRDLERLDDRINRVRYGTDRQIWGRQDYWADPDSFFARGGDCEYFAIAKYVELRRLGVAADRMRIVVGYDRGLGDYHAFLTVDLPDGRWVLDIPGLPMVREEDRRGFEPIFALNETALWHYR
jgi:predicted transglutaminase-like cysteine proteinase